LIQYCEDDFNGQFEKNTPLRAQNVRLDGRITVKREGGGIRGEAHYRGVDYAFKFSSEFKARKVSFADHSCSCDQNFCAHVYAAALVALEKYPELIRKPNARPIGRVVHPHKNLRRRQEESIRHDETLTKQSTTTVDGHADPKSPPPRGMLDQLLECIRGFLVRIIRKQH
jgi:hypothetical protein